jgi:hypothetical protein
MNKERDESDIARQMVDECRSITNKIDDALTRLLDVQRIAKANSWEEAFSKLTIDNLEMSLAGMLGMTNAIRRLGAEAPMETAAPPAGPEEAPAKTWERLSPEELAESLTQQLKLHGGNVSLIARNMNPTRKKIHRWAKRFSTVISEFRPESAH